MLFYILSQDNLLRNPVVYRIYYLKLYSTFGGLNSSFGAKSSFVLEIAPDDTEIYFCQGNGRYKLILKKNEHTGKWKLPIVSAILSVFSAHGLVVITTVIL